MLGHSRHVNSYPQGSHLTPLNGSRQPHVLAPDTNKELKKLLQTKAPPKTPIVSTKTVGRIPTNDVEDFKVSCLLRELEPAFKPFLHASVLFLTILVPFISRAYWISAAVKSSVSPLKAIYGGLWRLNNDQSGGRHWTAPPGLPGWTNGPQWRTPNSWTERCLSSLWS